MVSFSKFNPRIPKFDLSNRLSISAPTHPSPKRSEDGSLEAVKGEAYSYEPLPRFSWKVIQMAVLISMGGFIFGYDTGQISGFLAQPDFLRRFGQHHSDGTFYFSNVRAGLIVSLLSIGTLIGALIAAPIADQIGRRMSIAWWCVIVSVGFIVQIAASDKWYQIMMGRWVSGLGVGALSLLVPMYQAETAPRHVRGAMISCYQLFITLGIFLAACFNYATNRHQKNSSQWRIPMGVGWVWTIILGFGILYFPETPRYAYRKGRKEEARATMAKVHGTTENHWMIAQEYAEIEAKFALESQKAGILDEWIKMIYAPRMGHRLVLGMGLQMFQQLTGANYFFYYGTVIFKSTGINNSYVTQLILNGINFGTTFYGLYIIEHYGRRKSLMAGSAWMFICFLIFASIGHFSLDRDHPDNTPHSGIAMICFASFFIFGFATTWGPMIWTICGELYPSRYRAKAMSLSTASNWIWNFLLGFFTPFIIGDIDFRYGYVFAACNVLGGLIVYFFVIEGQGRTVEEIDTMYIEKVIPWQSAKWVAPAREVMDQIREKAGTGGGEPLARAESGIAPVSVTREQNGVEHPAMEMKEEKGALHE